MLVHRVEGLTTMNRFLTSAQIAFFCAAVAAVLIVGIIDPHRAVAEEAGTLFLPPDRGTVRKLTQSKELIDKGRLGEAVSLLGEILSEPEDYFFRPDSRSPTYRSLKSEAERLIGRLPRKGRELYELQYGAQARKLLDEALASGKLDQLAEASRRFFHTDSGCQATLLLGLDHFDHHRPLAGAIVLQRLRDECRSGEKLEPTLSLTLAACWLQAGESDKARESLLSLKRRSPATRVSVGGREVPIFDDDAKAVEWLAALIGDWPKCKEMTPDNWLMFRGNASRNAESRGGPPLLSRRWRVTISDDLQLESLLAFYDKFVPFRSRAIPRLHPLAVGDVLLMRTAQNLLAVDFATGKRLWDVPVVEPAELPELGSPFLQNTLLSDAVQGVMRTITDLTYGTLSSDGRLVYSIEDSGLNFAGLNQNIQIVAMGGVKGVVVGGIVVRGRGGMLLSQAVSTASCNRLAAYDIRTGKLAWELGGASGRYALRQADTFFLGPPLPLDGKLYVLAETKGEIRLLVLDAATGDQLWAQQLTLVEKGILAADERRWVGASPCYADGVLVCPTSTGAIVGVDLATRSLLWGYCYEARQDQKPTRAAFAFSPRFAELSDGWIDDGLSIHDGLVLASPQDSDWLYCLRLTDGELLWKTTRGDDLYIACVHNDKVIVVGRNTVRSLHIGDGKPAWEGKTITLPEGSTPSGRGFVSSARYFLPLSSAEIIEIDIDTGKIAGVSKSSDGTVSGNLFCHRGMVISQGLDGLDAYFQSAVAAAEVERRLKANPDDAWAILLKGEIQLDAGDLAGAIDSFGRAYDLDHGPRARKLLCGSLLEGLAGNFAAYKSRADEIESLLDDQKQRARYLRLMAGGLSGEDKLVEAFDCYLRLADLEPERQPLDKISDDFLVRRDRWIRRRLVELRDRASAEEAARIDRIVSDRMEAAMAADSPGRLQRFVNLFGDMPIVLTAENELFGRLKQSGEKFEAEIFSTVAASSLDGKYNVDWPTGDVKVAVEGAGNRKNHARPDSKRMWLDICGDPGPYFRDLTLEFAAQSRQLVARDGFDREVWRITLPKTKQWYDIRSNYSVAHARTVGRLLMVSAGWDVCAIDTLNTTPDGSPRLLWIKNLSNPDVLSSERLGEGPDLIPLKSLPPRLCQAAADFSDQANLLQICNRGYVCLYRHRTLVAVDPLTGETLWVRRNAPASCDVFGDDRHLFLLSTDREDAVLLRADDGAEVGRCKVPRTTVRQKMPDGQEQVNFSRLGDKCVACVGRKLLLWWPINGHRELVLIDPLEGRDEWPRRIFSAKAKIGVADDQAVGVMEPDGRFVLVSLPDGKTMADVKLEAAEPLVDINLFRSDKQYFLLTNSKPTATDAMPVQPLSNRRERSLNPIFKGRLYAFDLQGKLLWKEPTEIENQLLYSDRLCGLPVLVFASQRYERNANGRRGKWQPVVVCVDKRSGRKVYETTFANRLGAFDVSCDEKEKTISLTMQKGAVVLTYTNDPIPSAATAGDKPASKKPGGRIAGALWKSIKESLAPPVNPFEED